MKHKIFLSSIILLGMFSFILHSQTPQISLSRSGITVTDPHKGTIWFKGAGAIVNWTRTVKMDSSVRILLYPYAPRKTLSKPDLRLTDRLGHTITPGTPNDGNFKWSVPKKIASGLYLVVVETLDGKFRGESSIFTIKDFVVKKKVDLVVTAEYLYWTNPPEDPNDEGYIKVTIRNLNHAVSPFPCCNDYSEAASSPYCFKLKWENSANPAEKIEVSCSSFPNLLVKLKQQGWGETTISIWDPGWFPLKITVDSSNVISEQNEGNNTFIVPTPAQL